MPKAPAVPLRAMAGTFIVVPRLSSGLNLDFGLCRRWLPNDDDEDPLRNTRFDGIRVDTRRQLDGPGERTIATLDETIIFILFFFFRFLLSFDRQHVVNEVDLSVVLLKPREISLKIRNQLFLRLH